MMTLNNGLCRQTSKRQPFSHCRYDHDDVEASPACRRAVHEAVRLLREAGHHVEHFKPFAFKETFQLYFNHVLSDDGVNSLVWLENEIVDQAIEVNILVWRCAVWLRKYLAFPIANLVSPISAPLLHLGHRQSSDLWVSVAKLEDYFVKVLAEWRRRKIDTVIYPGFVTPAPFLKDPARLVGAIPTVSVNNLLGLPGGTLPITRVTGDDEVRDRTSCYSLPKLLSQSGMFSTCTQYNPSRRKARAYHTKTRTEVTTCCTG